MTDLEAQVKECWRIAEERCQECHCEDEDCPLAHTCRSDMEAVRELVMAAIGEMKLMTRSKEWRELEARLAALVAPPLRVGPNPDQGPDRTSA